MAETKPHPAKTDAPDLNLNPQSPAPLLPTRVHHDHNDTVDASALMVRQLEKGIAWHKDQARKMEAALAAVIIVTSQPKIAPDDYRPPKDRGADAFKRILAELDNTPPGKTDA